VGVKQSGRQVFLFGVVILAAGRSRRMGRAKLLLPWRTTTVLGHLLREWEQLGARQVGVVCAGDGTEVRKELDRLGVPAKNRIVNPDPDRGMFSSIQCATWWPGWDAAVTHWVVTLGDQPHLRRETLQALLHFGAAHPEKICQPLRNGRRKHPVLLPKHAWMALGNSTAGDLKQFLEQHTDDQGGFESEDAGLDSDMDTPEDYERLNPA
jgi:molybdenum cofactor cytidylyltransferase